MIFTARIRSITGRYCFHRCLSVTFRGVHRPGLDGRGVPIPGLAGGVPHPRFGRGGTPSQVWLGGGYPISGLGVPPKHGTAYTPQTGTGYPPSQTWNRVSPPDLRPGTPPRAWDWEPPPPQHSEEHLIRGGRYASCVHAGGLSCSILFLSQMHWLFIYASE